MHNSIICVLVLVCDFHGLIGELTFYAHCIVRRCDKVISLGCEIADNMGGHARVADSDPVRIGAGGIAVINVVSGQIGQAVPSSFSVGGVHESVTDAEPMLVTVTENASELVSLPSLTEIVISP